MKNLTTTALAAALLACPAAAEEPVHIGILLGFTGPVESLMPDIAASAELALAEAADSGRFLGGRALVPVRADSTCTDAGAATTSAQRLVDAERVAAIIGADCSGITSAVVANVTTPAGVVSFSPSATSPVVDVGAERFHIRRIKGIRHGPSQTDSRRTGRLEASHRDVDLCAAPFESGHGPSDQGYIKAAVAAFHDCLPDHLAIGGIDEDRRGLEPAARGCLHDGLWRGRGLANGGPGGGDSLGRIGGLGQAKPQRNVAFGAAQRDQGLRPVDLPAFRLHQRKAVLGVGRGSHGGILGKDRGGGTDRGSPYKNGGK